MSDHSSYQVLAPTPELEPFVECFWDLVGSASETSAEPEIVLPDGKTELIVHFGDDFFKFERNPKTAKDEYVRQARVLMSGQLTERILLRPSGRTGVVSVRFKAAGAARFFNLPYEGIVDLCLFFICSAQSAEKAPAPSLNPQNLAWLVGTWEFKDGEKITEETWSDRDAFAAHRNAN